jgi:hypothetical protein
MIKNLVYKSPQINNMSIDNFASNQLRKVTSNQI